jgi:hypothetical protein
MEEKGMYGMNVHRAIVENSETGISIHYVKIMMKACIKKKLTLTGSEPEE